MIPMQNSAWFKRREAVDDDGCQCQHTSYTGSESLALKEVRYKQQRRQTNHANDPNLDRVKVKILEK